MKISIVFDQNPYKRDDWRAYDEETYDAEVVDGEWTSACPVGWGHTKWEAAHDLLLNMQDAEENEGQ